MDLIPQILITLGALFLLGLITDLVGRRTPLPRVTLLLLGGFFIGPSGLNVLPDFRHEWFPIITDMALSMVGFLLGHNMTIASLQRRGKNVLWISVGEVIAASLAVLIGLMGIGVSVEMALILAGIAPASAPAATIDVIREVRANGEFTKTLESVVAIDDAWGLVIFSLCMAMAQAMHTQGGSTDMLFLGAWEIGGAIVLGLTLGGPMSCLTARIEPGEPTLAEALGLVLLCGGMAIWLGVSFILASMVMGAVVANLASHHRRPFTAIEGIEWPFMILFFSWRGHRLRLLPWKKLA